MPIRVLIVEDSCVFQTVLKNLLNSSPEIEVVGIANNGVEGLSLIPKLQPDVICTDFHMPKMDGLKFTQQVMTQYPRPILVISVSVQPEQPNLIPNNLQSVATNSTAGNKIVAIGTSTGGPQALQTIFESLPVNFPVPIVCVQHISHGFLDGLIQWLSSTCPLSLKIANPGVTPQAGTIYFPPEGKHLELDSQGRFVCSNAPPVGGHRPAVNVTFKSIARIYGREAIAVLLTGMGKDGAEGMQMIRQTGGFTIAQDQETSVIFGMPKEAIEMGAVKQILPIQKIAPFICNLTTTR